MKLAIGHQVLLQALSALGLLFVGATTIAVVLLSHTNSSLRMVAFAYGAALLLFGFLELGGARARWHGISVESKAFAEMTRISSRFGLIASHGAYKPGLGDIDLILSRISVKRGIRPMRNVVVAVEIKAYERFARKDDRMVSAATQAQRTASSLNTCHCIVWLPKARPTLWQRVFGTSCNGVPVILGRAAAVARMASTMLPEQGKSSGG